MLQIQRVYGWLCCTFLVPAAPGPLLSYRRDLGQGWESLVSCEDWEFFPCKIKKMKSSVM